MIHYSHFSSLIFLYPRVGGEDPYNKSEGKRENSLLILKRLRKYFSLGKMQMNTKIFRQVSLSYLFSAPPPPGEIQGHFFLCFNNRKIYYNRTSRLAESNNEFVVPFICFFFVRRKICYCVLFGIGYNLRKVRNLISSNVFFFIIFPISCVFYFLIYFNENIFVIKLLELYI